MKILLRRIHKSLFIFFCLTYIISTITIFKAASTKSYDSRITLNDHHSRKLLRDVKGSQQQEDTSRAGTKKLPPDTRQQERIANDLANYTSSSESEDDDDAAVKCITYNTSMEQQRKKKARTNNSKFCKCVNCEEDEVCGKIWNGTQIVETKQTGDREDIFRLEIHVVVSHCKTDLNLISDMIQGRFDIVSVHVISKCGYPVRGAPPGATIQVLPNVGRCDHSYAYYISNVLDKKLQLGKNGGNGENAVVAFLKDNAGARNLHQPGRWNSFQAMAEVASSEAGFSCGIVPGKWRKSDPTHVMSAYGDLATLRQFNIPTYSSRNDYGQDGQPFGSDFATWDMFYKHLFGGIDPTSSEPELVQVCFGGVFAASVKNIKKRKMELWKNAETSLSRGDNIQEGHYMERMWGLLLASPLEQYQMEAMKSYVDYIFRPGYEGGTRNEPFVGLLASLIGKSCHTGEKSSGNSSSISVAIRR
eukprot:scaffold22560_cov135-Cylindrotheca_fusiformis.AAC.22